MPNGTVKWFNNSKGYGFIVEEGDTEDLFAHFSSIQMEGYKTLKAGQKVSFEKEPNGKGIHAVNISSLEIVQTSEEKLSTLESIPNISPQETTTNTGTVNITARKTEPANDIAISA